MDRLVFCLALLGAAALGQTSTAVKPAASGHSAANDAEVEKAIRAKLAASKISTDNFEVHVQGGVATVTGRTNAVQHKGTATRLAKSAGAAKVVNHIEIGAEGKQKAASNLDSGRRRAQVKRSEVAGRQ